MGLKPFGDTVFGEVIEHRGNEMLLGDLHNAVSTFDGGANAHIFEREARALAAVLEAPEKQLYQMRVRELGPDCKEDLQVGDIAILPPLSGTMLTIVDEETDEYMRIFAISESLILAGYRED